MSAADEEQKTHDDASHVSIMQDTSTPAPIVASGSARQPNDAVPGDETVRMLQYFMNGTEFKDMDFGLVPKLSWEGGRQLMKSLIL